MATTSQQIDNEVFSLTVREMVLILSVQQQIQSSPLHSLVFPILTQYYPVQRLLSNDEHI